MITQFVPGVENMNSPMQSTDFKLYRNAPSQIEFNIKNNDRKPVNLSGKKIICYLINGLTSTKLLTRELDVIDDYKGKAILKIFPSDNVDWNIGFHKYSIQIVDANGDIDLLYTNDIFFSGGTFELLESVTPKPVESFDIDPEKFIKQNNGYNNDYYVSDYYPGRAQLGYSDTLHTVAIYCDNFSGQIYVQGSIEGQPSLDDDKWFYISLDSDKNFIEVFDYTGIEAFNFRANVLWVRFFYKEHLANKGKISKILFKN